MQQRNDSVLNVAEDAYERERLDNFHPARWRNPQPADPYALVVVGAGSAGMTAAYSAASLGVKVALIERKFVGGTCMNVGCAPSKALIRTSHLYADMRNAEHYGGHLPIDICVNFPAIMERMRRIRARLSRVESVHRLKAAGVDVFFGHATFSATDALTVDGVKLRFKKAMIGTGARPDTPSIPGLAEAGYLTNENVFDLTEQVAARLGLSPFTVHQYVTMLYRHFGVRSRAQLLAHVMKRCLPAENQP